MWWEYIQGQLIEPLKTGVLYQVKLRASLAEYSDLAIREFGIYFSEDAITSQNTANLSVNPQVVFFFQNYFTDTLNWIECSGYYFAQGGEKHLTIGNFKNNETTDTLRVYDGNTLWPPVDNPLVTYIYIDAVEVFESGELSIPNVFTPNNDGFNNFLTFPNLTDYEVIIYNRWGNVVRHEALTNFSWDGKNSSGILCSEGTYYYVIVYSTTKQPIYKGFVQLIH